MNAPDPPNRVPQGDAHLEDLIDEAVAESFPASDAPAVHPRRGPVDLHADPQRRKHAEDPAPARTEDALDARIVEQMAEAVIYADRDGVIRRWNRAAEAMFGFAASEALGRSLDLVIPERLQAAHWRGFDAAMKNGVTRLAGQPILTRGRTRSGEKLYVEMSFALVRDPDGVVQGSIAVARDVTRREAARQANRPPVAPSESGTPP
jgi:PAS domain S-box-containing protein